MLSTTDIDKAVTSIRNGGIIAYPTETLPGLGCLASSETAIKKLLKIKNRPASKGLILLATRIKQLKTWISPLKNEHQKQLLTPTTTPTTWLVPAAKNHPSLVLGKYDKLAVRFTTHPIAHELCELVGEAIISTSINVTGEAPALQLGEISPIILKQLDLVLAGAEGSGQPSEIRDLLTDKIQRR